MKKKIKLPIYYGNITILITKNIINDSKNHFNLDIDEYVEAYTYKNKPHDYILCFKKNIDLYNVVHEIVHLVNFIYEDHSIKLSKTNDEHQAYLSGYLFKKINKILNEAKEV